MSDQIEHQYAPLPVEDAGGEKKEILRIAADGSLERGDGRGCGGLYGVVLRVGVLERAAGSAYCEIGGTKVFVSVHGPRAVTGRGVKVAEEGVLNVGVKLAAHARGVGERFGDARDAGPEEGSLGSMLHECLCQTAELSALPKSVVDVNVFVAEDDGSVEEASLLGCGAALVDAGVPCRDLVVACTAAFIPTPGGGADTIVLNPTSAEQSSATASVLVVALGNACLRSCESTHTVVETPTVLVRVQGSMRPSALSRILQATVKACATRTQEILPQLRSAVAHKTDRAITQAQQLVEKTE